MTRVKRGVAAKKRKKNLLKNVKGFRWGRKSKFPLAKDALTHALGYAYRDRRTKKRTIRQNWQIQINAMCRQLGLPYNKFIHNLKNKKIELDRKILSQLAKENPKIFEKIVEESK
jgi:large subunit ribosomal protein L20